MESVSGDSLKNFLLIVAGLAATAYYIKEMFWSGEKQPQPFEVTKAKQYVHKDAFDKFAEENRYEHENLFSKIGGVERGARAHLDVKLDNMQRESNDGRDKLHDRINDVLAAVSELRGTVNELRR